MHECWCSGKLENITQHHLYSCTSGEHEEAAVLLSKDMSDHRMIYPHNISSKSLIERRHGDNLSSLKLQNVGSREEIQQTQRHRA